MPWISITLSEKFYSNTPKTVSLHKLNKNGKFFRKKNTENIDQSNTEILIKSLYILTL